MKQGNIALSAFFIILLTIMVWVNTQLKAAYYEIDLTDKLRSYQTIDIAEYSILKITGSNGYPIEISQNTVNEVRVLRSRMSQVAYHIEQDTLIIHFSGARVSPSSLANSTTLPGILILAPEIDEMILEDTHNRISGFDQNTLQLDLKGNSHTEFSDNQWGNFSIKAEDFSSFEFKTTNRTDTTILTLTGGSVGFLKGLSYHALQPVMKDSALMVLSKEALQKLTYDQ